MFTKNRELRIRAVKINPLETIEGMEDRIQIDPEQIGAITKDIVSHSATETKAVLKYAAIAFGAVVAGTTIVAAACEIAVNLTKD
jgi:hypothetical protein